MDEIQETEIQETGLPLRLAGRIIVLDPCDRVLLFQYGSPPNAWWTTPGGGADPGEDHHSAAQRELTEETGWTDVLVRPGEVRERWVTLEFGGRDVRQHEKYFLARVSADQRALGEVTAWHRHDGIRGARWWTVAELENTDQVVWPDRLTDMVRELASQR